MIYLDNAATSFPKPRNMIAAMEECALKYCGNPGRSGHHMSMKTGEEVYRARRAVADLFNIDRAERLVFTKNTTEALNLGLKGFLRHGDHVVTTAMEHNSVLRPLKELEKKGVSHSIVPADGCGQVRAQDVERAIRGNTRLLVVTAASNVTGTRLPLAELGRLARARKLCFMVDGAQGAGAMELDVQKLGIDMLAVPGHKGLLGPLGTGALYAAPSVSLCPLLQGGTGTESRSRQQPLEFPEGFEAGTVNAPAIIGLGRSAEFVRRVGADVIGAYEEELIRYLDEGLRNMVFLELYGPPAAQKTGISLFNIEGMDAEEVTSVLSSRYDIAVRGGYHCAGLAHKAIGTWERGAVRASVGPFNTRRDIDALLDALWQIGRQR